MYDPVVQLKSGGYLVINPTEALVSIDINSGRSTKEHNIEQTALHTNLEAAREIARQLRLRDMAGLVVIDFIDQEHHSNTRKVEKAMKEALKNDRARIQVGRISSFGLMEMSRQRLRTGVLEATTRECPHCDGTGLVRTASSAGLSALRLIEDEAAKGKGSVIRLAASTEAAVYLLNEKRAELMEIEQRYHVTVEVVPEGEDEGAKMTVSSHGPKPKDAPRFDPIVDDEIEDEVVDESDDEDSVDGDDDRPRKKRRRRRGGRGRNKSRDRNDEQDGDDSDDSDDDAEADRGESGEGDEDEDRSKKRRRRGGRRRGGRGRGRRSDEVNAEDAEQLEQVSEAVVEDMAVVAGPEDSPETAEAAADSEEKPKPKKRAPRKKKAVADGEAATDTPADGETEEKPKPKKRAPRKKKSEAETVGDNDAPSADAEAEAKPAPKKRAPRKKKADAETVSDSPAEPKAAPETPEETPVAAEPAPAPAEEESAEAPAEAPKPKRGWWQRTFGDE